MSLYELNKPFFFLPLLSFWGKVLEEFMRWGTLSPKVFNEVLNKIPSFCFLCVLQCSFVLWHMFFQTFSLFFSRLAILMGSLPYPQYHFYIPYSLPKVLLGDIETWPISIIKCLEKIAFELSW